MAMHQVFTILRAPFHELNNVCPLKGHRHFITFLPLERHPARIQMSTLHGPRGLMDIVGTFVGRLRVLNVVQTHISSTSQKLCADFQRVCLWGEEIGKTKITYCEWVKRLY